MRSTLTLGSLKLKTSVILSPLESVSCVGFRNLCLKNGAGLAWTEMVRAQAIVKNNKATLDLIDTFESVEERPVGIQLLAKSAEQLTKALKMLEKLAAEDGRGHLLNIAAVDLNFGCPSPEIIREGAGPALLKRRKKIEEIFAALVEWKQNNSLSVGAVGCKIRLGMNSLEQESKVYLPVVHAANQTGLDYFAVHCRNAKQRSSDPPTWSAVGEVKAEANMPVIGNGDITSVKDAEALMKQSSCDGVMIARAAIKNPWIFRDFSDNFNSSPYWPTLDEVMEAKAEYSQSVDAYKTKSKFVNFHEANFERLLKTARTGDRTLTVRTPNTIHLK